MTRIHRAVASAAVKADVAEQFKAEKATVIKATEQNTVSSEAETVQKHETVHEVADDRT